MCVAAGSGSIFFDTVRVDVGNAWQSAGNSVVIPPAGGGTYYLHFMVGTCYQYGTISTLLLNGQPLIKIDHNIINNAASSSREKAIITKLVAGDTLTTTYLYSYYGKQTAFHGFRLA